MEAYGPPYSARAVASMSLATDVGKGTVVQACRLFGLSRAAWYAAKAEPRPRRRRAPEPRNGRDRGPGRQPVVSADELRTAIRAVVDEHPAWGVRKVWATLRRVPYGLRAGTRRIWALMKDMGLCLPPDRSRRSDTRGHVTVELPNRRWATDLTTVWTSEDGTVAIVPLVDCGCRSALAVDVTKAQDSIAVLAPVRETLVAHFGSPECVPEGLELRTDHGPQYTGSDCGDLCAEWNVEQTLAPVGRPTGNAVAERLIRTLKEECIWLRDWKTEEEVRAAVAAWMVDYNERRPHQALGWQTPAERRAERLGKAWRAAA